MEKQEKLSLKTRLLPLLMALGSDFLFFWVVNVAFLTQVKGLSYEEFFSLDIIAGLVNLAVAVPSLLLVSKIGNNWSYKLGALCLVGGAVLFAFGNSYICFAIANILYYQMYLFCMVTPVIFENNLEAVGRKDLFLKYTARGRLYFSLIALFAVMVSGFLFDINPYIPMCLCIFVAVLNLISSFFLKDETNSKYDSSTIIGKNKTPMPRNFWMITFLFIMFILIIKGCFFAGYQYTKVSLQEIGTQIQIISLIIFVSRLTRVIINCFSEKIINKFKRNFSYVLLTVLLASLLCMSLPLLLLDNFIVQIIIISFGVLLLTSIYDLYKVYINYIIVNLYPKDQHLKLLWLSELVGSGGIMLASALVTLIINLTSVAYGLLAIAGLTMLGAMLATIMVSKYFRKKEYLPDEVDLEYETAKVNMQE